MHQLVNILKTSDIFFQFTQAQMEMVAAISKEKSFSSGDIIIEENAKSKDLYLIASGDVTIFIQSKENYDQIQILATLGKGQTFGEIALVDEGHRSASVKAKDGYVKLLEIPRDKLLMLCETYPSLGFRLMSNLAANLAMMVRNADRAVSNKTLPKPEKKQQILNTSKQNPIKNHSNNHGTKPAVITDYDKKIKIALSKITNELFVNPDGH
ncbi:MAG: cyclic nucleotide-binding domain-containing protein [Chloroflexota bacterium]